MELKFVAFERNQVPAFCSNRTFMELKCTIERISLMIPTSSNRTFMELK